MNVKTLNTLLILQHNMYTKLTMLRHEGEIIMTEIDDEFNILGQVSKITSDKTDEFERNLFYIMEKMEEYQSRIENHEAFILAELTNCN